MSTSPGRPGREALGLRSLDHVVVLGANGTMGYGSAALFTSAKVAHLAKLPQGNVETAKRVVSMVHQMDQEGFGHCTNTGACEVECPQEISITNIDRMNWEYNKASLMGR